VTVAELTDDDFDAAVTDSAVPVLVDFWAPWCGPCRMMAPILDGIAENFAGRLAVVKVNIDDNPALVDAYSVQSIPALCLITDGTVVKRIVGAKSKSALIRELTDVL
jgi:thioredoxin 1